MNKKKALFLCSGREGSSELMMMKPLVRSLQAAGYVVEYYAPEHFTLRADLEKISWQSAVEYPGLRWLHRTFVFPLVIISHCATRRYDAILSSDPYLLFVSWPASLLIIAQRILLMPSVPWRKFRRRRRFILTRFALAFQDFLGMLSASKILVTSGGAKKDVAEVASLLAEKAQLLPVARSVFAAEELLAATAREHERDEVLERYDLAARTRIFCANINDASFEEAERCLRLFAVLATPKRALFFLGENEEQNALMAITVGLGLVEHVFFVEAKDEEIAVVRHSDIYFVLDERDEGSYVANLARVHGAVLVPIALPGAAVASPEPMLDGRVARDAEAMEHLLARREELARLREKQARQPSWIEPDWGLTARAMLHL